MKVQVRGKQALSIFYFFITRLPPLSFNIYINDISKSEMPLKPLWINNNQNWWKYWKIVSSTVITSDNQVSMKKWKDNII